MKIIGQLSMPELQNLKVNAGAVCMSEPPLPLEVISVCVKFMRTVISEKCLITSNTEKLMNLHGKSNNPKK